MEYTKTDLNRYALNDDIEAITGDDDTLQSLAYALQNYIDHEDESLYEKVIYSDTMKEAADSSELTELKDTLDDLNTTVDDLVSRLVEIEDEKLNQLDAAIADVDKCVTKLEK